MGNIFIKNIKGLVQAGEGLPDVVKGADCDQLKIIENAFLALENGSEVAAYGPMTEWEGIDDWRDLEVIDAEGCYVMPAFCDSHTHTVFAKTREEEFVDRIRGLSYEEIALKGGGILNSAQKLGSESEIDLYNAAEKRIEKMIAHGTGAVEIKSGYGLSVENELKILRVVKKLKRNMPISIKSTFLGAHAFPIEYKKNHEGYISLLIDEMLPKIAEEDLADYIDVFCERNYFSVDEMTRILEAGKKYGLIPKVHVNQFSTMGGVKASIDLDALSVDHLEELNEEDIKALKNSSTIATFLPGCSHFLSIPFGDARRLINENIPFALASDFNPGSSPCFNLLQIWSLACIKMNLTPNEAFNALTINGAAAMGLSKTHGKIKLGVSSPIILTHEIPSFEYIPYSFGESTIQRVFTKK
ncbi:MAG: imidazolonepropionase [Flavobacteriales bacterium]|nr:MAG: imidazolonepropionase [Flavobacteriales bacterium]